ASEKARLLGTCYFYRAFSYYELCRRWGGMPYFEQPVSLADNLDVPRDDMRTTYLKAADDFQRAADLLQPTVPKSMWQHPTSVAALAFKAKCILYAASPQATKEGGTTRESLWAEAAEATEVAIKAAESNGYAMAPTANIYDIYNDNQEDIQIAEVIWGRRHSIKWNSDAYLHTIRPPGTLGGKYGPAINQSLVNAFDMENGYPITDPRSNYDPQDPYKGRGARFEQCILHNQSEPYPGKVLNLYNYTQNPDGTRDLTGSADMKYQSGKLMEGYTPTGTYIHKWMGKVFNEVDHRMVWPEMRITELYIMFAEAATEAGWDWKTVHSGCTYSALAALNKVRNRAGIADVPADYCDTKDHFMERVQNERRVELCFEDQRFYDIRRLLIGKDIDQNMYRVLITKLAPGYDASVYPTGFMYEYDPVPIDTHVYTDRMNLFPINRDDINMCSVFKQNPGW
ncbi:MAG: RagB/SusD family nutrient uptake outer membrane protein, partial [Bacteroidales bacterium]|nr:RagB/SusD family nutrient uptake outer membrane protein [Bacteroidales bacterium]